MKVLFDEDVPRKLMRFLPQHDIETVVSMDRGSIKNGALLNPIEAAAVQVFITGDKAMQTQQRLEGRLFAVLIMSAINWPVVRPHVQTIAAAIETEAPGTVNPIACGTFNAHDRKTTEANRVTLIRSTTASLLRA